MKKGIHVKLRTFNDYREYELGIWSVLKVVDVLPNTDVVVQHDPEIGSTNGVTEPVTVRANQVRALSWVMQVKVKSKGNRWCEVAPTGGQTYRFTTRDEAKRCLNACYPDQCRLIRLGCSVEEAGVRVAPSNGAPNYPEEIYGEKIR